ncbi:MAG: flagellar hook-basal body complex protein [Pirellulales bacterium]
MGLQSAMTTALTGLQAAETTIDVVGNNVANSNTVGFKESNVLFATQFYLTQAVGSAPNATSGGTNPRQIGLGVNVAEIAPDFTQGTIQVSANPLDLAIQGDGFFMVQGPGGGAQRYYTRNGQFKTNAVNELTTVGGDRVLGFGVNDEFTIDSQRIVPLTIPFGSSAVAQETNNVRLVGNLPVAKKDVATQPGVVTSVTLNDNSVEIPNNIAVGDILQIDAPMAGSAAAAGPGTGLVGQGRYNYKVAFVDPSAMAGFDEAPPSPEFGNISIPVAGTDSIQLTALPVSTNPAVYSEKRIYRINLDDPAGQYQLVAQIPENQVNYTDTAATASLGPEVLNDNNLDATEYNYFYTFVDASGSLETRPTNESATISISTANRRIRLDNIPQPSGGGLFTNIRIYRNVDNEPGKFYLVDEVPAGTTTYIDKAPDSDIKNPLNLLDRNGPPVNTATPLIHVATWDGSQYVNLFQPGTLQFTGSKGPNGGLDLAMKELTITNSTTVSDLLRFMQESLGILTNSPDPDNPLTGNPGGSLSGLSQLQFESNDGIANEVNIKQTAFRLVPTSGTPYTVPLTFSDTHPATGAGSTTETIVYDSLGIPLTVRLTTVLESTSDSQTTYRWYATSPDNQPVTGVDTTIGTGIIRFNGQGKFISATDTSVSIDRREVASNSPVTFDWDFTRITALSQDSNGIQASSQDGFAAGTLASFSITETGRIKGVYSNGVTRDLGQLLMSTFANPGGLQQIGDNLWAQGVNSGEPLTGIPGENGNGTLTSGAVELSNTDIGQNLIDLILASTQYRGGTRVITSAQQLLDELLSLRR